jgi:hypothetical protein
MPDVQPTHDLRTDEGLVDWLILDLLIDDHRQRPWTIQEVIREHGHLQNATDALDRLHAAGLIHQTHDGFVFASRAAVRFNEIKG